MKKRLISLFVFVVPFLLSAGLKAEYVGDRLYLGLYEQPDTNTTPLKTLNNGTKVEILQTQGAFLQVRISDGTEGWVRAEFISKDVPASEQLKQVTAERDKMRKQMRRMGSEQEKVKSLQADLKKANRNIGNLKKQLAEQQAQVETDAATLQANTESTEAAELQERLEQATAKVAELESELESVLEQTNGVPQVGKTSPLVKVAWTVLSMLICLAVGIMLGIHWLSGRVKQRFNGLKVW